eukprot:322529-Chlamydomonas_euryale.AAC.2
MLLALRFLTFFAGICRNWVAHSRAHRTFQHLLQLCCRRLICGLRRHAKRGIARRGNTRDAERGPRRGSRGGSAC